MTRYVLVVLMAAVLAAPARAESPALDVQGWRQDLALLAKEMPARHPNLFYRMKPAAWDSAVAAVDGRLPGMTRNQAMVAFMELTALPRDGHTAMSPFFIPALHVRSYPLDLYAFDDGLFIRAAAPAYAAWVGARVVRIGKLSADDAMARMGRLIASENEWWTRFWAPQWLTIPELLDGTGIAADMEKLPVVVEKNGRSQTLTIAPAGVLAFGRSHIAQPDRTGWTFMGPETPPLRRTHPGEPYWVEYVAESKMLYVGYRGVVNRDDGESNPSFWRRVFAMADSLPVARMVIDLRENMGGNGFYNRQVVRGLIARPALDKRDHLFVLIGRSTFSAAMNLVKDLEQWTNATLVGEPTGNATAFFGDHQPLSLPHSGLTVMVSGLPWWSYDSRDRRDFVPPMLFAPPTSTAEREGRDPALEAIAAQSTLSEWKAGFEQAAARGDTVAAESLFAAARRRAVNRYRSLEAELNTLGYSLLNSGHIEPAIAAFRINTRAYPASSNTWDSLGEGLVMAGHKEEGISAYRRALSLDPSRGSAREALARLGVDAGIGH